MSSNKRYRNSLYARINYIANDAGLDKNDRLYLAKYMFNGIDHIESYSELTEEELEDIAWLLKGWRTVQAIRHGNGHLLAEAEVVLAKSKETAVETAQRQDRDDSWD